MSGIEDKKPILSICIPTWNRAKFLEQSLIRFSEQIDGVDSSELELYVSDNCSDDNTPEIVNKYIANGLPIRYNRNEKNLGAAGNFVKCMQWASGKYILLLGDDDILKQGALKYILDILRGKDYGLIHLNQRIKSEGEPVVYTDLEEFLKKISFWFTFMSGSIFRKDIVAQIEAEKYIGTHLLQMPYYLTSATKEKENLLINTLLLETGLDYSSNGGYNFYEVFVKNYLNIWLEFVKNGVITRSCYEYLKKDIYQKLILGQNFRLLVRHQNVQKENISYIGNRKGYKIAGAKDILNEYYGKYSYYKLSWITYVWMYVRGGIIKVKNILKQIVE